MIALNSIVPQYYSLFSLILIGFFELMVVCLELLIFHFLWQREYRVSTFVKNEDGYFIGFIAIIVGNIVTFFLGMLIYILFKGVL